MARHGKSTLEMQRRKRERYSFIKRRYIRFLYVSKCDYRVPYDWRNHLNLPEIQSLIQEARTILVYSPFTPDYTIWLTLYYNFYKTYLKPKK